MFRLKGDKFCASIGFFFPYLVQKSQKSSHVQFKFNV